ncbi:MAG TPA: TolC family protein [Pedobacter sp.]|jgi:outer membrane protein
MKFLLVAKLFLLCSLYVHAQQVSQPTYTLQQCIEIAIANNLLVKRSELEVQTARVNLNQAKSNLLPDLSANVNHGTNQGRSIDPFTNSYVNQNVNYANYSLNSGIVLFNGLILKNLIKQNALIYEAEKMEQQQAKDDLTLNVLFTYFQILSNEDQLNQARLQADVSRKQIERSDILNKAGAISPSQLSDLRGQLGNDELAVINSSNALTASKITLSQLMNVPFTGDFTIERLKPDALSLNPDLGREQIYATALQQLAIVKGASLRKKGAQTAIKVAGGDRFPQLSLSNNFFSNYSSAATTSKLVATQDQPTDDYIELNGSKLQVFSQARSFESSRIGYTDQIKNNYSSSFNLGLRIPVFNALRTRNQVRLAKIELKNADLAEETIMQQLKQAVDLAWFNMSTAKDRLQVLDKQVAAFRESFKAADVRFTAGAGTVIDYTLAKNNLDRSVINLINARYDIIIRSKVLDYYQGKL